MEGVKMKNVFIKYNPYKLETEITVDKKKLAQNSKLREKSADGSRLQEWVEDLPGILIEEYNDKDFKIVFHGTLLDYEDLIGVFKDSHDKGKLKATIEREPAIETSDKEALIDDVFKEIQKGPFDDLRDAQLTNAFKHAKSSDFEVCVVATMSAGKSTLINAMLGTKLMPSKQEACTAIITRIKDISTDNIPFRAEVYDQNDQLTYTHEKLNLAIMEGLNDDKNVSVIKVSGNIPFVSSDDVSLVLIDTPGPNNSRDPRHKKVQSELLGKSSKALVLYIMTGEFGTDDDNTLLKRVAESMAVSGKQSKDRFIFVVNKLDDRKKEDGDTNQTLERIRSYLKSHGIANPNLFPAASLPALSLRMIMNSSDIDDDTVDETEMKVRKLNRNEELHFETYAALPASIRDEIKGQLINSRSVYKGKDNENKNEALIHTGIVSIEAAIRQYVQKYAKTAKIKNIVDTFMHKLDEVGCFEETKQELAKDQKESERIVKHIDMIREKIDSVNEGKKFKNSVDNAVVKVNDDSKEVVEGIIQKFQSLITKRIDKLRDSELDLEDVEDEVERLEKFAKQLEPDFEVELEELIRTNLVNTSNALYGSYRKKLSSLIEEIGKENLNGITIDPLKLMSGSVMNNDFSPEELLKEKKVEDGQKFVETRGWFESILFWPKNEWVTNYKNVSYVNGSELAQKFFMPVEKWLSENGDAARKYALKQSKRIADRFNEEFKKLDEILKQKLAELENCATDKEKAEERIRESERKLKWLEQIKSKVESILEI
jgi:predicted GTPase/CHASE3 domain sensor protein